jgi:hypothetical protein
LHQEANSEERDEDREILELSHAKSMAILEKENVLLQSNLHEAHRATEDALSKLASVESKVSQHEQEMSYLYDKTQEENSHSLGLLKTSLDAAECKCEQLQVEMKGKDSEVRQELTTLRRLRSIIWE